LQIEQARAAFAQESQRVEWRSSDPYKAHTHGARPQYELRAKLASGFGVFAKISQKNG